MKIGVFDSGLGGLTVLGEIRRALPQAELVYLGDTARTPYGSKASSTVVRYAKECTRFLTTFDPDLLVVACNTVSCSALDEVTALAGVPVIGTIAPAVEEATELPHGATVVVLGTEATIASGVYDHALRSKRPDVVCHSIACPLFVPFVEFGLCDGDIVDNVIRLHTASLLETEVDAVILACTHYPLLKESIQRRFGANAKIIECSRAVARACVHALGGEEERLVWGDFSMQEGRTRYFVTDEPGRFNFLAKTLLKDSSIEAVRLETL